MVPKEKRPSAPDFEKLKQDTLVVRISLDQRFCTHQAWKTISQRLGTEVRKWLLAAAPDCQGKLLDTWSWELQPGCAGSQSVVRGLCRIKKGNWVSTLLQGSGRNFFGIRCFLDPLDWYATPQDSFGSKPFISWVDRKNNENDHDYAGRVVSLAASGGVARGWRQLGLRSKHEPTNKAPEVRSWILRSAPRFWSFEQVEGFLEAAGFSNISIGTKSWERQGTSWGFRGSWINSQTYVQLLYDGDSFDTGKFLVAERSQRIPKDRQVTKLRGESRISLNKVGHVRASPSPPASAVGSQDVVPAPTQLDEKDGEGEQTDMDQSSVEKREAATGPGGSPEKKRQKTKPLPSDTSRIPNQGAGDCLFLSICDALAASGRSKRSHREIRAMVVSHLRKHKDKYFYFWDGRDCEGVPMTDASPSGFETYLTQVSQVGAWAGNLEVAAAAATMDTPIVAVHDKGQVFQFNSEGSRKDLFLYYQSAGHYEALQTMPESAIVLRSKAMNGKPTGGRRGGGKSSSSIGGHTRRSRSASTLGGHTRSSQASSSLGGRTVQAPQNVASVLGGHTRGSASAVPSASRKNVQLAEFAGARTAPSSSGSTLRQKRKAEFDAKPLVQAFAGHDTFKGNKRDPKESWTCPHKGCGITLVKTGGPGSLTSQRARHLAIRHPEIPRSKDDHLREYAAVVEASAALPMDQRDWNCPWCAAGLPWLPKPDKDKAVSHHYATRHPRRDTSAGRSNAVRAALARKGSQKAAKYLKGKKTLGEKLRKRASDNRNWSTGGAHFGVRGCRHVQMATCSKHSKASAKVTRS